MRRAGLPVVAAVLVLACATPSRAAAACPDHWVGAWSASPSDSAHDGFGDQTLREIVTPHLGGSSLRIHLSNRFGRGAVTFDAVSVALRDGGAALVAGSARPVTFAGARSVTIAPGQEATSDAVAFQVAPFHDLAVSLYTAGPTGPPTEHFIARQTSFVTDA